MTEPSDQTLPPDAHGVVYHADASARRTDYLYRISLKCLVRDAQGCVLVVKESGRSWWDLPGGGMDHGESIRVAIAREMKEEVNMQGNFAYRIIEVDEPAHLHPQNFWQLRLIFDVTPESPTFSPGDDGDETSFRDPADFKDSTSATERQIYHYAQLAASPLQLPSQR